MPNDIYKMLRVTGYSYNVEELVEVLSSMRVPIYTRLSLKESSVFNFQPQPWPCPERVLNWAVGVLTVSGPKQLGSGIFSVNMGPALCVCDYPPLAWFKIAQVRMNVSEEEGLLWSSLQVISPGFYLHASAYSLFFSSYGMGFSLCIYLIFCLIYYHAHVPVKSAITFAIIWLWSSSVYCCLVCL